MIAELPGDIRALYPFAPHWTDVAGYQLHHVDEGPRSDTAVVLLHGNPTWSFLYRDIIPTLVDAGLRVIAPDFLGSGRSDHARTESEYAIVSHVARTLTVLESGGVKRAVMFMQDWGGPIGFGMNLARPGLLAGMVLANTFWGEASVFHRGPFWRSLHAPVAGPLLFGRRPVFLNGLKLSGPPSIHSGAAWDAYTLPFRTHHGAGATLAWPRSISLGPTHPTAPLASAIWESLPGLDVPVRFVWGARDVVFPPSEQGEALQRRVPRGGDHPIELIPEGRHFVQEYAPDRCAAATLAVAEEAF